VPAARTKRGGALTKQELKLAIELRIEAPPAAPAQEVPPPRRTHDHTQNSWMD
jgi:hypothetical protein